MSYQQELQAKLDAVRAASPSQRSHKLDTAALEAQLIDEIEHELELSQYDLDESDILRSIKILDILNRYPEAFSHHKSLTVLYILAKTDVIQVTKLFKLTQLNTKEFKSIINAMARHRLLIANGDKEIELTSEGMSLTERIGFHVFV
jgi:predicted transcriptional regulator